MPLPQRRDILATLTFTQVVKIFLPLTKIIKIKFMGAFLILVIEKISSIKSYACLKQDYFPWHFSTVFYVFLILFKRFYPVQWNWIFWITVKQTENITHLTPIGWLMERQSIIWQATRLKTGFQFPTWAKGFVIKCIISRTTAGTPSSGHVVKDGRNMKLPTRLQLPFKTRNTWR